MRLSVCMIVGNDAATLPRAVGSAAEIADEVVILATAGTEPVERALPASARIRLVHFSWCDDFSMARNASFSIAAGEWILWLDADEWLDSAAIPQIQACLSDASTLAWLCWIQDQSGDDGAPRFSPTPLPRLFRRMPQLQVAGRVHEQFSPDIMETARRLRLHVRQSDVRIFHDGYSTAAEAVKLARNIRLMQLELNDNPQHFQRLIRLSQALLKLGKAEGLNYLLQAWRQIADADHPPAVPLAAALLDSIIVRQTRGECDSGRSLEELHAVATAWFPRWPPLIWRRANWHFKLGRIPTAARELENILKLAMEKEYQSAPSFDMDLLNGRTHMDLGICYAAMGVRAEAIRCFDAAMRFPRWTPAARRNLEILHKSPPG